eukprot:PITA_07659
MVEEYASIIKNNVWEVVPRPKGKSVVTSRWLYNIKHVADGSIKKFKARFVARGFSQIKGVDYDETFVPVARYTSIRSLISITAKMGWQIHQMDVKTAFLNGVIEEEVYVEQRQGFEQMGFTKSDADPNLYYIIVRDDPLILLLYVDGLFIIGAERLISVCKEDLIMEFEMKDIGLMHYFLGLEVWQKEGHIFLGLGQKITSGGCFELGLAVVSWFIQKQKSVALSSSEAEYMAANQASCEAIWLRKLLHGLFDQELRPTVIHYDSQSCIKLTENPVFHDRSKHIDIRYHFIKDYVHKGVVKLEYISTDEQVAVVLTKSLPRGKHVHFRDKMDVVRNTFSR